MSNYCISCVWGLKHDKCNVLTDEKNKTQIKCIHNIDEGETTLKWLREVEEWYCNVCEKHMYEELVE